MRASEIRGLALNEAGEKLAALKAELAKERAVLASGTKPENPGKTRALRRDIARILTIMGEKQKAGEKIIEKKDAKVPEKKTWLLEKKPVQKKEMEKKIKNNKKVLKGNKKI